MGAQQANLSQQGGTELIGAQLPVAHGLDLAVFFRLDDDHRRFLAAGFIHMQCVLRDVQRDWRTCWLTFYVDQECRTARIDIRTGGRTAADKAGFGKSGQAMALAWASVEAMSKVARTGVRTSIFLSGKVERVFTKAYLWPQYNGSDQSLHAGCLGSVQVKRGGVLAACPMGATLYKAVGEIGFAPREPSQRLPDDLGVLDGQFTSA